MPDLSEHEQAKVDGIKKQLRGLILASCDIRAAIEGCEYLLEHRNTLVPQTLFAHLHDSIIINYARPFTANEGFSKIDGRYEKFDEPQFQELHNKLLWLRHKVVAHTAAEASNVLEEFEQNANSKSYTVTVSRERMPREEFNEVRQLCLNLLVRLEGEAFGKIEALERITGMTMPKSWGL